MMPILVLRVLRWMESGLEPSAGATPTDRR